MDDRNGNLDTQGDLVVLDRRTQIHRCARSGASALSRHCLSAPAPTRGTPLDRLSKQVSLGRRRPRRRNDRRFLNDAQNNAIDLLEPGTQLLVGSGAAQETVTVLSTAAPDIVNLTAAFANAHSPGDQLCRSSA